MTNSHLLCYAVRMTDIWDNEGGNMPDVNALINKWWESPKLNFKYTLREYMCKEMKWSDQDYDRLMPEKDKM